MTDQARLIQPMPMEGGGAYNRSSRVQAAGLLPALALFEQAARTVTLTSPPPPVMIADYGSSEGHNSLLPVAAALGAVRERVGPERAICVVHTNLPDNPLPGNRRSADRLANHVEDHRFGRVERLVKRRKISI